MLPRPRFRLPISAALAICAAAYVGRSILRGWKFKPDLPADAIVLLMLLVVVAIVAYVRVVVAAEEPDESDSESLGQQDSGPPAGE